MRAILSSCLRLAFQFADAEKVCQIESGWRLGRGERSTLCATRDSV
jgi:hypothetical protein